MLNHLIVLPYLLISVILLFMTAAHSTPLPAQTAQSTQSSAQDHPASQQPAVTLRVATFNASLNRAQAGELLTDLQTPDDPQIRKVAEIIQRIRPDILLLNEFDYVENGAAVALFQQNYLQKPQQGTAPIYYPYTYLAPVNTGIPSGFDLDKDGTASDTQGDALGYGAFPGQYGMVILSRHPVNADAARTFRTFLWRDMPDALLPEDPSSGAPWYTDEALAVLRLSSKSHWDVPVVIQGRTLHLLASHPTPPVFDGPEDRNGRRNHDEIRFWHDYINPAHSDYIYDDQGRSGGLAPSSRFVVLGDLNASPDEGDATQNPMAQLLDNPEIQSQRVPTSAGGRTHQTGSPHAATHTADWGMRADYVLPSRYGLKLLDSGVFWPDPADPLHYLVGPDVQSSDHRLVWVDLELE